LSKLLTSPALPELAEAAVPAGVRLPARPAQQPRPATPRVSPAAPRPGKAAPAMWESLRPAAPKAAAPKRPSPAELARAEAEAIVVQARAEAERLQAQALKRAEAEGKVRGKAQARVDLRRMMREARGLLEEARALRGQALAALGDEVVDTAVALAKAVVCRRVEQSSDDLRALALQLIAEARDPGRVRVNPADAPALDRAGVAVEQDTGITRGGFVLFAADGERDARLETRIARLEAAVREEVGR
jgi:flagellar biosynthesis/type III secretory pathway protein FliH